MAAVKSQEMVQCIRCKHGHFMQWMKNPIICECTVMQNERFVAEAKKICQAYEPSNIQTPTITHFDSYND